MKLEGGWFYFLVIKEVKMYILFCVYKFRLYSYKRELKEK